MAASSPPAPARISTMMSLSSFGSPGKQHDLELVLERRELGLELLDLLGGELLHLGVALGACSISLASSSCSAADEVLARLLGERGLGALLLGQARVLLLVGEHGRIAELGGQLVVGVQYLLKLLAHGRGASFVSRSGEAFEIDATARGADRCLRLALRAAGRLGRRLRRQLARRRSAPTISPRAMRLLALLAVDDRLHRGDGDLDHVVGRARAWSCAASAGPATAARCTNGFSEWLPAHFTVIS